MQVCFADRWQCTDAPFSSRLATSSLRCAVHTWNGAVAIQGQTGVITMTLTSAACPLTGVMENQIRTGLAAVGCIEDFPGRLAVGAGLAARRYHRQRS